MTSRAGPASGVPCDADVHSPVRSAADVETFTDATLLASTCVGKQILLRLLPDALPACRTAEGTTRMSSEPMRDPVSDPLLTPQTRFRE